jgi:dihydrofolate reductase
MTTRVITGLAPSLDGFIAGADDGPAQPLGVGGERLFDWFKDGDTRNRVYEWMRMSEMSAEFFDSQTARVGAAITGRRTYDISGAWGVGTTARGSPLRDDPPDP